jgi:hypothetical protein
MTMTPFSHCFLPTFHSHLAAASLIRQLLAFSRKQVVEPSNVPLNPIVRDIDNMLRRLIGEDIKLVTVLQPRGGCVLVHDTTVQFICS